MMTMQSITRRSDAPSSFSSHSPLTSGSIGALPSLEAPAHSAERRPTGLSVRRWPRPHAAGLLGFGTYCVQLRDPEQVPGIEPYRQDYERGRSGELLRIGDLLGS